MLGKAAVVIWFDVAAAMRAALEDWHTHEHMPERVGIPGFLRGSRWVSGGSYCVLYELDRPATLTGAAYLKRLNNPTPGSRKFMPHHRNMTRSLCRIRASFGGGLPGVLGTLRASSPPRIKDFSNQKGLSTIHLLQSQPMPRTPQTTEQKIRGGDAHADWVVLVGGYQAGAVKAALGQLHAPGAVARVYRLSHSLSATE
jgi:hypothetical protein